METINCSIFLRVPEVSHLLCDDEIRDEYISLHDFIHNLASSQLETTTLKQSRSFLRHHVVPVSCVYLLMLGQVQELRKSMSLSGIYKDDMVVCKYGCTEDFGRRLVELARRFSEHSKDVRVAMYCCIDSTYIMSAETSMKKCLSPFHIVSEISDELVVLPLSKMSDVKKQLENIHSLYSGKTKHLMMRVEKLEHLLELERSQHKEELLKRQLRMERLQHELITLRLEKEFLTKSMK